MQKGLLIILSGPSGVGKGTVIKELMKDESLKLTYSISMTTRTARPGEVDGVNYFFVDRETFNAAVDHGELLEHANFIDNLYGTPKRYVEKKRAEGYNVILEIETVGAKQVMRKYKYDEGCISIFITPPSLEELAERIRNRKSEAEEIIERRLRKAQRELKETFRYKYVVCNDDLALAIDIIKDIIKNEMEHLKDNA